MNLLEERIKAAVPFKSIAATGFHTLKCPVCKDKKTRAGFKFEEDKIIYSCFRGKCPIGKIVYEYGKYIPHKLRSVLSALNVEIPVELLTISKNIVASVESMLNTELYEENYYHQVSFPNDFIKYDPSTHPVYKRYLEEERGLTDTNYYIGRSGEWMNKLIIPFYFHNKLIGWQGYDINKQLYLKNSGNSDVIYCPTGYVPKNPIVVEGAFDAKAIPNGVAVLQSTVSKKQAFHLKDTTPILLPDKKGSRFLEVMKQYNWKFCIPEWKEKDVDEATRKYGLLIVARMIYNGLTETYSTAEIKYNMWRTK